MRMAGKVGSMTPLLIAGAVLIIGLLVYSNRPSYGPEQPFLAKNGLWVAHAQAEGAEIEVYSQPGAAGPDYFCAAAEFAVRYQKRSRSEFLVVVTAEADSKTRSGFRSVHFQVVGKDGIVDLPPNGAAVSVARSGEHRTVAFAEQLC
jgi:hypothetical protein